MARNSHNLGDDNNSSLSDDIRVVIGFDFGTTYSGFAYCHTKTKEIITNESWPGSKGQLKTPTVIKYTDNNYDTVKSWGYLALAQKPRKRKDDVVDTRPIEHFKLRLGDLPENLKPKLPVSERRIITDYFQEIGNLMKETVERAWPSVDFLNQVLLVLTVPAEFSEKTKKIVKECMYNANLIKSKDSINVQFTTEPEAAAIYCMKHCLKEQSLLSDNTIFMTVDCGGGTVDLTTRKLLAGGQLGEITERAGDFCGSTFVDQKFLELMESIVGKLAMKKLKENNYSELQYLVREFCEQIKFQFTGDDADFHYEIDLESTCPVLKKYVTGNKLEALEKDQWEIDIKFDSIKIMFDPIIDRIIRMIKAQLDNSQTSNLDMAQISNKCSAIFLVGGFSQSKYLFNRIKREFADRVENISVPTQPNAAICRGAAMYGLSMYNTKTDPDSETAKFIIGTRILKYTYGVKIAPEWTEGDPPFRKLRNGRIHKFSRLAQRGVEAKIDQEFSGMCFPVDPNQCNINFEIYITENDDGEYCDEVGMKLLGSLKIDLPDAHFGLERPVRFSLMFGRMEITASAKNMINGQNYHSKFRLIIE
ncbi:actin-like ATPase domain-containing protein [Gigaspora margarita]|uniref:Actin-like ATPase domain-containing protein n=1 Tax=Gigaspora margarita TaxID=4874 RepID=A0A8H4B1T3_GIGMA|nr:actin-like ATPase domain-containing protein [Gigaspora margarita]